MNAYKKKKLYLVISDISQTKYTHFSKTNMQLRSESKINN